MMTRALSAPSSGKSAAHCPRFSVKTDVSSPLTVIFAPVRAASCREAFSALILEVPFDSLINVVKQRIWPLFPFDSMIKDQYDNTYKLAQLKLPVLIMGAAEDKVVPVGRAKALYKSANHPKEMIIYPDANHSDLYDHKNYQDILNWLKDNEEIK